MGSGVRLLIKNQGWFSYSGEPAVQKKFFEIAMNQDAAKLEVAPEVVGSSLAARLDISDNLVFIALVSHEGILPWFTVYSSVLTVNCTR